MAKYFAGGHLRFVDGEWRDDDGDAVEITQVKHGEWEVVKGVLTPGGDPLLRCPYCRSRESEHLCGVEHPSNWLYCPVCGAKLDRNYWYSSMDEVIEGISSRIIDLSEDKSRCRKCVNEMHCPKDKDKEGKCPDYKRDAPDGGYYG